jgi:hypothetical protein
LLDDLVNGGLHRFLFCYVGLQGEHLVGEFFGEGGEFDACFACVDGVDCLGAVGETSVCYAEADAAVCAGDGDDFAFELDGFDGG